MTDCVGFWEHLADVSNPWFGSEYDMCVGWYFYHSGEKTLSPFYHRMHELYIDKSNADKHIADFLKEKYLEQWKRIYTALTEEYSPLDNHSGAYDYTDTRTYDVTEDKDASVTYGRKDTATSTSESTSSDTDNGSYYGFNSSTASNRDKNVSTGSTERTANDTNTQSGTDTADDTRKKTGTETLLHEETKSYRDKSGAELTQEEVTMRINNNFFDIVYRDIDRVLCLGIYH